MVLFIFNIPIVIFCGKKTPLSGLWRWWGGEEWVIDSINTGEEMLKTWWPVKDHDVFNMLWANTWPDFDHLYD